MRKNFPFILIFFRLCLVPIILGITYYYRDAGKLTLLILMYFGLISDIIDGIIARQFNVSSAKFRRWDSQTDMLFWLSIGISTWMLNPDLIRNNSTPIVTILVMEASCYLISFLKFRKETCTHAFLSKLWGISLLVAFTSMIWFGYAGIPFMLAIIVGLVSHVDRILITLFLPKWTHDIPSAYHAYLIGTGGNFKRNKYFN